MKIRHLAVMLLFSSIFVIMACQPKEVTSAKVYLQQDEWDKAIEQLEIAVEQYPENIEAPYLLGLGYANNGEWEKMNVMFNRTLALDSTTYGQEIKATREKHWVTAFNSGVNRINSGDLKGAVEEFTTCTLIEPNRPEAYRNLAIAYTQDNDMVNAKKTYELAIEKNPQDIEMIHGLVAMSFEDKEYDKVIELEKKVLENNPENTDAVANMALAYDMSGQKDKALETYEQALAKNPNASDLLFNKARLHYMNEEYEKAIELFQQVIAHDPDDVDANINVGNAYLSIADNMRKKLVERQNNGEEIAQEERDQMIEFYSSSIPFLEKAIEARPDIADLWNNLGIAYVQAGEGEKGSECFKKVEELQNQ